MKQEAPTLTKASILLMQTALAILMLILTACSTFKSKTLPPIDTSLAPKYNWQQIRPSLEEIKHWQTIGKINIRTPEDSVTVAINNWTQTQQSFSIDLSSTFFGLGATKLFGNEQFLTILKSDDKPLSSNQPNLLVSQTLGFPLPISYLPFWIKALPMPEHFFNIQFYQNGLPKSLFQDSWKLEFSKYMFKNGLPFPGKIKLQHKDTRIILVIKKWTLL